MKTIPQKAVIVAAGLLLTMTSRGSASDILLHLDTLFPSDPVPSTPAPWVDATFQDLIAGTVRLTVSAVNLANDMFIDGASQGGLFFNLNPSLDPTALNFTLVSANGSFSDSVFTGLDAFRADGDGYFDINLNFSSHNFSAGSYVSYDITGINNLTASDFAFISSSGGGQGQYYAAAHLQGAVSTWAGATTVIPVPEPGTGALFLVAAIGLWGSWRFRWQKASRN